MTEPLEFDMALEPAQFLRWLPGAVGDWPWRLEGDRILVGTPERGVAITLSPLPPRSLGLLRLPRTRARLEFHHVDQKDRCAFLARFETAFHRGGG